MIRNLSDLAASIGISDETLERWISQGKIPVSKKGYICEFDLSVIRKWAASRKIILNFENNSCSLNNDHNDCLLADAIKKGGIYYDIEADNVESVLAVISELVPTSVMSSRAALFHSLMEREKIRSTGIGKGIAIPHPQKPMPDLFPDSFVVTCFMREPLDFSSMDGKPVSVIFTVVAPNQHVHLNILSRLSFCLKKNDFIKLLSSKPDQDQLLEAIDSFENQMMKRKYE